MAKTHSFYHLAYPIFAGEKVAPQLYKIRSEILGTAIFLGDGYFLTAGHVVEELRASQHVPLVGIFAKDEGHFWSARITQTEPLPRDLGVFTIESPSEPYEELLAAVWSEEWLGWADDVEAYGYAYGLHRGSRTTIVLRAFKGSVVADVTDFAFHEQAFHVYELSFAAPRGLSGAPLFRRSGDALHVHGIVIGNSSSSMLVLQSKEVEQRTGETVRMERYETLNLGIAVHAREVLAQRSELLKGTIGEHLRGAGKVADT